MNITHLQPFLDATHRRDTGGTAEHISDEVVLRSPTLPGPLQGKTAVGDLLRALLTIAVSFEVTGMLTGDDRAAVFLTVRSGDISVDGIDDMRVDATGRVSSMTIQWRPLPAIVTMQGRLAPLIGAPGLALATA